MGAFENRTIVPKIAILFVKMMINIRIYIYIYIYIFLLVCAVDGKLVGTQLLDRCGILGRRRLGDQTLRIGPKNSAIQLSSCGHRVN